MDIQCVCIHTNEDYTYIYGNNKQLRDIASNLEGLKFEVSYGFYGQYIKYKSISCVKTCLLRNGYKFSHVSQVHSECDGVNTIFMENWIKGI